MKILHLSAECYPMAKVGGLADVVGALTKYINSKGISNVVVVPMHRTSFLLQHYWEVIYEGKINLEASFDFTVINENQNTHGLSCRIDFPL